jgi:glutamate-5-semialdehyde dehydrogenase
MTGEVIDDYPETITSAQRAFQASLKLGTTKGIDRSRAVLANSRS